MWFSINFNEHCFYVLYDILAILQLSILSKFSHPNIVRFLGISTDEMDQSMYLLLELMEGGDLRTFIRESRPKQVCLF